MKTKRIITIAAGTIVGFVAGFVVAAYLTTRGERGAVGMLEDFVQDPDIRADYAHVFTNGLGRIIVRGKHGFIDREGRVVIAPQFERAWPFSEGLACVGIGEKVGFIDKAGKFVIPPRFAFAGSFSEGLAAVESNGLWGFIDKKGDWAIEPTYRCVSDFSEGLAPVEIDGKWGFINKEGTTVIPAVYDSAGRFFSGLAPVQRGERFGYIDPTGKVRIQPRFSGAREFLGDGSHALVSIPGLGKDQWGADLQGFIDKSGQVKLAPRPDVEFEWTFSEGLLPARKVRTNKYGYLDQAGAWAIPPRFDRAVSFTEGLAPAAAAGKWGFIDKSGRFVIPPNFDEAMWFAEGRAYVRMADKAGYIDRSGKFIWQQREPASTKPAPEPAPGTKEPDKAKKNLVILMERYNLKQERYERTLIEDPAGVRAVQGWLDRNSRDILPLNQVGAVIEACSLLIAPRERLDSPDAKRVVLFGEIQDGRRAIEEAELERLFDLFSKYGKPRPASPQEKGEKRP